MPLLRLEVVTIKFKENEAISRTHKGKKPKRKH